MKVQHLKTMCDQTAGGSTGHEHEGVHDQGAGGASSSSGHQIMPGKSKTIEPNSDDAGGHAHDQGVQGVHGVQFVRKGGLLCMIWSQEGLSIGMLS